MIATRVAGPAVARSAPLPSPPVVLVHNHYQQPGGEDAVFESERQLLGQYGHDVRVVAAHNDAIATMGKMAVACATIWNRDAASHVRRECEGRSGVVAHFHNTFPLVSPAAYYAARSAGAAVVQTLHNYRLICPGATLYRNGRPCESCVTRTIAWPGIRHKCYRDDRPATAVVAAMLATHHLLGTWTSTVSVYIALTEFARQQFIAGGLPARRVVVKPNFLPVDPGPGTHDGNFALFAGRLAPEKGIDTLLDAWEMLGGRHSLRIAGAGPLERARTPKGVEWLGWQSPERMIQLMQEASLLIFPSTWYEGFPVTLLQAFATALPILVSGHGSMAELVEDGRTGRHFPAGDARALAEQVSAMFDAPDATATLGLAGRRHYEQHYTAPRNYAQLLEIYRTALGEAD